MIKFLVIFAAISCVAPQRSIFVDYILDLQYAVGFIHDHIQDTTWQSRYDMSDELTLIVEGSVQEITSGLSTFLTIRDRANSEIEEHRNEDNSACVDAAIANFTAIQTAAGDAIAVCGSSHMDTLSSNVRGFHSFIHRHRNVKFDAQNIVLSTFTQVNPMTNFFDISPTVEREINEIYDFYEAEVHPGIRERLSDFETLRLGVPAEVHDCVATALNNFDNDTTLLVRAAQAC